MTPTPFQKILETCNKHTQAVDTRNPEYEQIVAKKAEGEKMVTQAQIEEREYLQWRKDLEEQSLALVKQLAAAVRPAKPPGVPSGFVYPKNAKRIVLTPGEIDRTLEDLRHTVSCELKEGKVRAYVEVFEEKHAVVEWEKEPREQFTLLRLIPEAQWKAEHPELPPLEPKGKLPKSLNRLLVAGPDGKTWVISDDSTLVVVRTGGGEK